MKNILGIAKRDFKAIGTNWVMLVVTIGLIILPSLYAWFNIKSSWDPYGSTSGIKVAIVNEDEGSLVKENKIVLGDELVDNLKNNTKMGWQFVSREDADKKVENGSYYASILIPKDFTKNLTSVLEGKLIKPKLVYTVNEKSNAIAPKITEKGVSTIKEEIDGEIVKTVDEVLIRVLTESGIKIIDEKEKINKVIEVVYYIDNNIGAIEENLKKGNDGLKSAKNIAEDLKEFMPKFESAISDGISIMDEGKGYLVEGRDSFDRLNTKIKGDFDLIIKDLNEVRNKLENIDITEEKNVIIEKLEKLKNNLKEIQVKIDELLGKLERINKILHNKDLESVIQTISLGKDKINNLIALVEEIKTNVEEKDLGATKEKLLIKFDEGYEKINSVYLKYDTEIAPYIKKVADYGIDTLTMGKEFFKEAEGHIPTINNVLSLVIEEGGKISGEGDNVLENFPGIKKSVHDLRVKLDDIKGKIDINELRDLLGLSPKEGGVYLSSPVDIEENILFHIPNYGSAMSPFFTTLALWVGALILMSILAVDPHSSEIEYTYREKYFGKLIVFLSIGLLQGLVVSLGDIYILKAYVSEPFLFVASSMYISVIFMIVIYTLVSLLGNVGKAIGVILLVLQISSSGGTFPVEVMPKFFQTIHPMLPFTYGIGLMRDATGGIVKELLVKNIGMLTLYGIVFLIIGVLFKKVLNEKGAYFKEKLNKSGMLGH